jgi:excisionase family DNA binding protein
VSSLDAHLAALIKPLVLEAVKDAMAQAYQPPPAPVPNSYLSPEEAGLVAGVTAATVRSWVKSGALKAYWAGRLMRVKRLELDEFMSKPRDVEEDDLADFVKKKRRKAA